MTSESMKCDIDQAYQLGWMAFENGDDEPFATADGAFGDLVQDSINVGVLIRAYNRGFDDAMIAAIQE